MTFSPVFKVLDGEHRGETAKSMFGTTLGFHTVGSVHEGLYHPKSGMIESKTTFGVLSFFTFFILVGSIGYYIWRYDVSSILP